MKKFINKILRKGGIQIKRYLDDDYARRMKLMDVYKIDTLFDIGANVGQYALNMRDLGYKNRIISFEPLKSAYEKLSKSASNDKNWITNNYALGNEDMMSVINIAGNSYSSSILEMLPAHMESAPESVYIAQEEIEIKKLDSIFNSYCNNDNRVMIKIDTQGFEKNVLEGAENSLKNIQIIQVEMSIIPLYENELLFIDMINYLESKGFQLMSLENGFYDKSTGQLLQVDGIFAKKN